MLAAFAAGPLCWWALWMQSRPVLTPDWVLHAPVAYLMLAFLYPLGEELAFRGLLQGALAAKVWGRRQWAGISLANIATSLIFAAAHLWTHSAAWAAAVIAPSLVFGYFRDRTAALTLSIALHVWYNAGYFLLFPPGAAR